MHTTKNLAHHKTQTTRMKLSQRDYPPLEPPKGVKSMKRHHIEERNTKKLSTEGDA